MSKRREDFEKWALDMEIYLATDDDGNYVDYTASASWHAWQAASPSSRGEAVYQWREIGEREWREAPSKEFFDNRDSDPTCDTRILYTESCVVAGEVDEVLAAFSAATVTPDNRMYFNSGQDTTRMRKAIAALTAAIGRG